MFCRGHRSLRKWRSIMIPVELAKTPELSRLKRENITLLRLVTSVKRGDKSKKQLCLWQAQRESMNEREFFPSPSELPFWEANYGNCDINTRWIWHRKINQHEKYQSRGSNTYKTNGKPSHHLNQRMAWHGMPEQKGTVVTTDKWDVIAA